MDYSHLIQTPFLVRPSPNCHESPLGYLVRVAEDNGWTSHESLVRQASCTSDGRATYIWQIATSGARMQEIERLLVKDPGTVSRIAYANVSQGRGATRRFRHVVLPADMFEFGAARFCPACLESSPHRRDLWDLAPIQSCADHGLLLQHRCPHCGAEQKWTATGTTTCGTCFSSLLDAPREGTSPGLLWITGMIVALLDSADLPSGSNLFPGNAENFLEVIRLLALFISGEGCRGRDLPALPLMATDTARQTYETVAVALQNWPTSASDIVREQRASQRQRYPALGPQVWEKRAQRILSRREYPDARYSPWTTPLRDALAKDESSAVELDHKEIGGGLLGNDTAADLLSLQEAAKLFGASLRTMRLDSNLQCLDSFGLLVRIGTAKWVDGKQLDALFEKIQGAVRKRRTSETITLAKMQTTLLGRHGRNLLGIVQAIINGQLVPVQWMRGTPLPGIEFDLSEVRQFLGKVPTKADGYTIPEMAEKLQCLTDALRRVIKVGLLKAPRIRCSDGHYRQIVPRKELDRFDAMYVFSATLAKEVSDEPRRFAEKLMDEGVKPISGPEIDGGLVYAFCRKDLNKIDLRAIAKKTSYKKLCGRKTKKVAEKAKQFFEKHGLLTAEDVAKRLDTSIQKVSQLAKQGLLVRVAHEGKRGNRRYFRQADVDSYLAAYRDNPDLILEQNAAGCLGISLGRFRVLARNCQMVIESDGLQRYVRRAPILLYRKNQAAILQLPTGIQNSYGE